jgi:peroxiredoxin Q/BCP
MTKLFKFYLLIFCNLFLSNSILALEIGKPAPLFSLFNQDEKLVSLEDNKNKFWSVVYFYPKAETPGCTKQACAFRDAIKVIEKEGAVVYGVSTDSVSDLKQFKKNHKLNFDLLSDKDGKISTAYGTKMPLLTMSKRVTFIIDKKLNIRSIDENVDPAMDAKKVADKIKNFNLESSK